MVTDSETFYAQKIASIVERDNFEACVVAAYADSRNDPKEKVDPARRLFYAGAMIAAGSAVIELNKELQSAQDTLSVIFDELESALQSTLADAPNSAAVDSLLTARSALAGYSGTLWEHFWTTHKAHFAEFFCLKAHVLSSPTTPDYSAIADSLTALGEAEEAHPFFVWYYTGIEDFSEFADLMREDSPMTLEQLQKAVERFKAEPYRIGVVASFLKWASASWEMVREDIRKEADQLKFPTLALSYAVGQKLGKKYSKHGAQTDEQSP